MKHKIFIIRDSKVESYGNPFVDSSVGMVERSYRELIVNKPDHQLVRYHMDHDLYCTGEYCQFTGKITSYDSPQHICKLTEWLPDATPLPEVPEPSIFSQDYVVG